MNVKISKENHMKLCELGSTQFLFGSQLHGIAREDSDKDYIRLIDDKFYDRFTTLGIYFPNFHSFQYDDVENNSQFIWMTLTQFYRNLFSGDGNMIADIVILNGKWENALHLCRTYKIMKGYLGVAKRDLKLHGNDPKKQFHAYRSMYMAKLLMENILPTVKDIQELKQSELPDKDELVIMEKNLRARLNKMLDDGEIDMYPVFQEVDPLVQIMINCNNVKEFKYD